MKPCCLQTGLLVLGMAFAGTAAWPADPAAPLANGATVNAAAANGSGNPDTVTLNLVNADIEGVVKVVSQITGKNFVLDPRVKGTVNIVSAKPIARTMVYDVFVSALRLQGFAVIEDRGIVKIVVEADAKLNPGPTFGPAEQGRGGSGDRIQTRLYTLKYESAAQLIPILRPLISPNNSISVNQNSNTLVVTDYANNLQRIEKIINAIDQPNGSDPIMIQLQHASAVDVAVTVSRLFAEAQAQGAAADPNQRVSVSADGRSNSLLVRSDNPARLAQVRKFVALLDSPAIAGSNLAGNNVHVVYLKNAQAVKLAETLRAIYQTEPGAATDNRTAPIATTALGAAAPGALPVPGAPAPLSLGPQSTQSLAPSPGIIQADPATNSIIITAPDAVYNNLRAVLDQLDVRRAQVYVEALIAELTAEKAAEFGIQWQNLSGLGKNNTQAFGGTNFGNTSQNIGAIAKNPAGAGRGLNVGIVNGQITIPGIGQILNLGLLIRALETDASANILSTPTLLTLDNEEAAIVIGQNLPFITGQYALSGTATTPTPFQTVERRDVGLTLRIKPQISEGGTVRLQIYQEVSSVQDATNLAGVVTNKRAVASTVMVNDGEIVVIGGLMQNTVTEGEEKVPVLGDLPLLGGLFRYKKRAQNKTNLMIFLRPTLVRDSPTANAYTADRYDYIVGQQVKARPPQTAALPDMDPPVLPPRPLLPPTVPPVEVKPSRSGAE